MPQIFTPDYKWGPISFMRLTHEAIRAVCAKLQQQVDTADDSEGSAAAFR